MPRNQRIREKAPVKGGIDRAVLGKKQMSEEDIKLNFIKPAIQPNWQGHITMETKGVIYTPFR